MTHFSNDIPTPRISPAASNAPNALLNNQSTQQTLCVTFAQQYGLPVTMARPFNNYGPGLKITDRRVMPDFARDLLAGRDIVMFSDGSPTRTFCYVADAVIGYYKVLLAGPGRRAYNVGVEKPEISMAELAERMAEIGRELFGYRGASSSARAATRTTWSTTRTGAAR